MNTSPRADPMRRSPGAWLRLLRDDRQLWPLFLDWLEETGSPHLEAARWVWKNQKRPEPVRWHLKGRDRLGWWWFEDDGYWRGDEPPTHALLAPALFAAMQSLLLSWERPCRETGGEGRIWLPSYDSAVLLLFRCWRPGLVPEGQSWCPAPPLTPPG